MDIQLYFKNELFSSVCLSDTYANKTYNKITFFEKVNVDRLTDLMTMNRKRVGNFFTLLRDYAEHTKIVGTSYITFLVNIPNELVEVNRVS